MSKNNRRAEMFAERVQALLTSRDVTQKQLAEALGITPQAISYYLNNREPSYDILVGIADYFDVTTDYLLGRVSNELSETQKYISLLEKSESVERSLVSLSDQITNLARGYIQRSDKAEEELRLIKKKRSKKGKDKEPGSVTL